MLSAAGLGDRAWGLDSLCWQESLPTTRAQGRASRHPSLTCSCWTWALAPHQPSLAPVQENLREELAERQEELQGEGGLSLLVVVALREGWGGGPEPNSSLSRVTLRVASRLREKWHQPLISRVPRPPPGGNKRLAGVTKGAAIAVGLG